MTQTQRPAGPGGLEHDLILDFDRIDADMLPVVGGKAVNLGVLIAAGFPVPPGFCLTTEAYRRATRPAGLEQVTAALRATAPEDTAALAVLAGRARALVLEAAVPPDVNAAVREAYARLGPGAAVAVRSSATAEDLPFASFAGQQDTFLNVVGADAVLDAVRRCWASLWTDRAVTYRATNGVDHATVTLAVAVQRMVDVAVAGVLFTANPVTGRRHEAVIDASPGLGEAVVSGAVNPDRFVVDAETGQITERRFGDKQLIIRALPGGGTERVPREAGLAACLDDEQIRTLTALGRWVESHYAAPQDIEWAIDGHGKPWLTQARAITTLFPLPSTPPAGPGTRVCLCFSLAQGLTRPITPMGLAAFRLLGASVARAAGITVPEPLDGPPPYVEAGQRFFIDVTPVVRSSIGREIVPRVFDVMEARSAVVLRRLFDDPRFSIVTRSRWPLVRRVARVALRTGVLPSLVEAAFWPRAALRRADRRGDRLRAVLAVPTGASALERLVHAERILGAELFPMVPAIMPLPALGLASLALARRLLGSLARPDELQTVLRGLPNNVTTEMDLALWRLASRIRGDADAARAFGDEPVAALARGYAAGALPRAAQTGLAEFLARYGDRAVAEIDLGMPRWSDDPTHIIGVLVNYLRLTNPDLAPDRQFESAAREAEDQVARLVGKARTRGRLRGTLVRVALSRTRLLAGLRELPKFYLVVGLAAARRQILLVGSELADAGRIAAADDVFFLDLVEAKDSLAGANLRGLVAQRRGAYELELRRRHIPRLVLSDGTEPESLHAPGDAANGDLVGSPASAGSASGPARVILDPVGARLEPGEILVAPSTDPGWTPLFLTAGGLVMEMGGANSHGAVVAREYGIPAVVGVPDATSRIVTGQRITVDGAAGTVALD